LKKETLKALYEKSGENYKHSLNYWVNKIWDSKTPPVQSDRVIGWTGEELNGKPVVAGFKDVNHAVGERKDRTAKGGTNQRVSKEWAKKIPQILAKPDSIYWDESDNTYLFYRKINSEQEVKIVVKSDYHNNEIDGRYLRLRSAVLESVETKQNGILLFKNEKETN
jgi:hypothetical protein